MDPRAGLDLTKTKICPFSEKQKPVIQPQSVMLMHVTENAGVKYGCAEQNILT